MRRATVRRAASMSRDASESASDDDASTSAPSARDLYAALGVRRDASAEDIKRAYRAKASAIHPDKVSSGAEDATSVREAAQRAFATVSEAYEILSDSERRGVYDVYGIDGARAGRELGARGKTVEELRVEFARQQAKEAKEAAEAKLNFNGTYIFGFSAAHLVEEEIRRRRARYTANPGLDLTSVSLSNSMEIPLSDEDVAYFVTQGSMRGGRGGGNFILGWRRAVSPLTSVDVSAQTGLTSAATATITRQLTTHTSGAISYNYIAQQGLGLNLMLERQLFPQTRGHLSWNVGPIGSMSTGASHAFGKNAVKCDLTVGLAATGIAGSYVRQVSNTQVYRAAVKAGTTGMEMEVGTTNQVDEDTALGFSIVVSLRGLTLKFRMNRQGQRFIIPVLLTPLVSWRKSLVAFTLPPIALILVRRFLVRPLVLSYVRKRQLAARKQNKRAVLAAMRAAFDDAKVIEAAADKKARAAQARGGLVIEAAVFGAFDPKPNKVKNAPIIPDFKPWAPPGAMISTASEDGAPSEATPQSPPPTTLPPPYVDVTKATQFMVDGDTLDLYENVSMSDLLGFCDPCPGEDKFLRIRYRYRRSLHEVTVKADTVVSLPSSEHRLPEKLQTHDAS